MARESGVVTQFNAAKGIGFIRPDNGGKDVVVHSSAMAQQGYRALGEGERVDFEVTRGPKGLQAEKVTRS